MKAPKFNIKEKLFIEVEIIGVEAKDSSWKYKVKPCNAFQAYDYLDVQEDKLVRKEIELQKRINSLKYSISFACHMLSLCITGYRTKKGTIEETLLDNVDRATKEYARIRK